MTLTDTVLGQIMSNLPAAKRQLYLPFINIILKDYEIDTPLRTSAFLAQIAHESAELRYMEEIWGPTDQQKKYEPPTELAKLLGNTEPGDGFRYRGRGAIAITGRNNYQKYGDQLGVDLVNNPDLAATPQYAFATAGLFWKMNGLNELADVPDFTTITKRINGGLTGLEDREKYYAIAKKALCADLPEDLALSGLHPTPKASAPPLLRGQEVIEPDSTAPDSQGESRSDKRKKPGRGLGRLLNWFR